MSVRAEIDSASLLQDVRRLAISARRRVSNVFSGQYASVFKGRGMEFSQVREYQPGDEPKSIDWNVSARTGHLFTKEFVEEREQTLLFLLDTSRSLYFGSRQKLKSDVAAEVAALLTFAALYNHDKVGLLSFGAGQLKFVPPRKGQGHGLRLVRDVLRPPSAVSSCGTTLGDAFDYAARVLKRRAVCFVISDFLSPLNYEKPMRHLAQKHDLTACLVRDPLEIEGWPQASLFLKDAENNASGNVSAPSNARESLREFWKQRETFLGRNRVDILPLWTNTSAAQELFRYFRKREKRR